MSKRKKKKHMLSIEFKEIVDAIADKLLNPVDDFDTTWFRYDSSLHSESTQPKPQSKDLPEGIIIEYEVDNLKLLAQTLRQKLPIRPPTRHITGHRRVKMPKGNVVLWHGTSVSRAHSILESGFKSKKRGVFFSSNIMESLSYAERRASDGHSEPTIFAAIYDLNILN